jgi:hypothetical protein
MLAILSHTQYTITMVIDKDNHCLSGQKADL